MTTKTPLVPIFILLILPSAVSSLRAAQPAVDLAALTSPILIAGDDKTAYRDPTAVLHDGTFHLFATMVRTEEERRIYSYTVVSRSTNLRDWTTPTPITPKGQHLNYSSPGNVVRFRGQWVICLQTYPRLDYRRGTGVRWADRSARIFIMRSENLIDWSEPELLRVKGPDVPVEKMGRMIDPYLIEDKDRPGRWLCFYKQNGVSMSSSVDLVHWQFLGSTDSGENVCVLVEDERYLLIHSPANGMGIKRSTDLKQWHDWGPLITLGQQRWPWTQTRLTAGFVLDLRDEPDIGRYVMFFHGSGPGAQKTQDNVDANCSLGIAWSNDLRTWDWPREK